MTSLLELKQHLKLFYSKFDTYIIPVLKFLLALAVFFYDQRSDRVYGKGRRTGSFSFAGAAMRFSSRKFDRIIWSAADLPACFRAVH